MAASGVFEGAMEEQLVRLQPGDVCVMYTDGITEARNGQEEEFGYDRLRDVVSASRKASAEEIKIRILEAVRTFAGGSAYTDDMTLVVVKWLKQDPSQTVA